VFYNKNVNAPVFDANGLALPGTNYLAELYGGPTPEELAPAIDWDGRPVIGSFQTPGYFGARNASAVVTNVFAGAFAWLQIRAWDSRLDVTYEEAAARGLGGYGESPLFYARGGSSGGLELPKPLLGLQSFRLRPTTLAVLMRSITQEADHVVIEWNPGFKAYQLQETPALGEPWQNVGEPTTATRFTTSTTNVIGAGARFFRVIGFLE